MTRPDGSILELWGVPVDRASLPPIVANADAATVATPAGELRVLSTVGRLQRPPIRRGGDGLARARCTPDTQRWCARCRLGVAMALIAAAVGGWLIGRQTLKPLTRMAEQASRINERDPRERLVAPPAGDELGQLAVSFNGLLDRLASALNHQRQFMADASHELRTPVSVVRTATQVTLAREVRSAEEYREALVIVGEQASRLSRLVDAMFLLSRAEAHGVPLRREFLNLDDLLAESARALRVLANQRSRHGHDRTAIRKSA